MAKKTLESFIDEYIKKKIKSGEAKGYGDYISSLSSKRSRAYEEAARAETERAISREPTHGRLAEALSGQGLLGGGYATYLKNMNESAKKASTLAMKADHERGGDLYEKSYAEYLKKLYREGEGVYESAKRKLESAKLVDYGKAYEMAENLGLTGDIAEELAESATSAERERVREQVIAKMLEKSFTDEQTYRYALSRGLSIDDAKELKLMARRINESVATEDGAKTFLDYLREISKNKN